MLSDVEKDLISEAFRNSVDSAALDYYGHVQEPSLSARIGERIQERINKIRIADHRISVFTTNIKDRGFGSDEYYTGIDLYVGINVFGYGGFSKGIFVQSKWKEKNRSKSDLIDVEAQCTKMLNISEWSYIWLFSPFGVDIAYASEQINRPFTPPEKLSLRGAKDLMREILDCNEGGRDIGFPNIRQQRSHFDTMMREWRVRNAVIVQILQERDKSLFTHRKSSG